MDVLDERGFIALISLARVWDAMARARVVASLPPMTIPFGKPIPPSTTLRSSTTFSPSSVSAPHIKAAAAAAAAAWAALPFLAPRFRRLATTDDVLCEPSSSIWDSVSGSGEGTEESASL
jgi:hypothetical protein